MKKRGHRWQAGIGLMVGGAGVAVAFLVGRGGECGEHDQCFRPRQPMSRRHCMPSNEI